MFLNKYENKKNNQYILHLILLKIVLILFMLTSSQFIFYVDKIDRNNA